ncbi:MAG TPA: biotin/lipoyl-binding protein [Gemmataceae bacterium]|nr:biotin/lipoyl-binding protein [Gemmataceae bacterium]
MGGLAKLLLCAAGLTAGAVSVEAFHRTAQPVGSPPAAAPEPAPSGPPPTPFKSDRLDVRFEGPVEVTDDRVARVTFKEGERIFEVAVRPGQTVRPGDLLFTLKGVHLQQLEQAAGEGVAAKRKRLAAAVELVAEKRRLLDQARRLQGTGAATADEVRRADADVTQAARAVEVYQAQLREQESVHAAARSQANEEYVTLPEGFRHPAGIVRRVTITPGEMRRGTAFQGVEVANIDRLTIRAVLPAADRRALAAGRRAGTTVNATVALDGDEYPATLEPPGVEADPATGVVPTVVTIENTREPRLPLGARVQVHLTAE